MAFIVKGGVSIVDQVQLMFTGMLLIMYPSGVERGLELTPLVNPSPSNTRRSTSSVHLTRTGTNTERTFKRHLQQKENPSTREPDLPQPVALIPYNKGISDKVGIHDIRTIFTPPKKIGQTLRPVKDQIKMENPGVYAVPSGDCEAFYIGETNRQVRTTAGGGRNLGRQLKLRRSPTHSIGTQVPL